MRHQLPVGSAHCALHAVPVYTGTAWQVQPAGWLSWAGCDPGDVATNWKAMQRSDVSPMNCAERAEVHFAAALKPSWHLLAV
jgi:hypothetical protein